MRGRRPTSFTPCSNERARSASPASTTSCNSQRLGARPTTRKIGLTDALPRRPGVYLFADRTGEIIYVGKADNLRTRVRSYFYGDDRRRIADMLRQLHRIDHRVCVNTLDAEVTELRLIHAHRPRFNQRSRPPRRELFVKVTDEAFPRLSQAHSASNRGLWWLGPFRSKQSADQVTEALWAATRIRRCSGRPGSRAGECAPAQLGVSMCPCAGGVDAADYRRMIDGIIALADRSPATLLEPLELKMRRLAVEQRFEEAAQIRDRHRALARALERQRAWRLSPRPVGSNSRALTATGSSLNKDC